MRSEKDIIVGSLRTKAGESQAAYISHTEPKEYPVSRSFYHESVSGRGTRIDSVLGYLPTLNGQDCSVWIKEKIDSCSHPIKVLDIGCGTGRALGDIEEAYPERVIGFGITACRYPGHCFPEGRIRVGDASHVGRYFPRESFDIIYSCQTLPYTKRPLANLIPKIYRILKPGGAAFLDVAIRWFLGCNLALDKTFIGLDELHQ